jgi:C4-dicarboxylate-specific signal transduction histidine kinase
MRSPAPVRERVTLAALALAIAGGTFLFDLEMPIGVAAAVPYALLVLLSLRSASARTTWLAALVATVLTLLGTAIDSQEPTQQHWKAYVNRSVSILTFWMVAALGVAYKRSRERLRIEDTALLRTEQLASLGEMAAGIAHELGTPLGALQGRLEMLEQKLASGRADLDEVRKTVAIASALGDRMTRIVRAVRTLARDASADPFVEVPLERILRDTSAIAEERLRKLDVELRVGPCDERLHVPCREAQIVQVLLNLISNSADAVQELPERWIRIDVSRGADAVEIAVTDSGPGIPPALRSRVMQPFFTTKGPGLGTGLGLSVSRALVESHAGTLSLDPASPRTRFVVALPLRR